MYRINGLLKSGCVTIDIIVNLAFIASKAFYLASVYSNDIDLLFSFLVNLYMDFIMSENPFIYY